jgi:hypothetical protein
MYTTIPEIDMKGTALDTNEKDEWNPSRISCCKLTALYIESGTLPVKQLGDATTIWRLLAPMNISLGIIPVNALQPIWRIQVI